ncbi:hypothetical protein LZ30DRAFT_734690 [Colletotrichum cereale]|nr:hypothetical protein LZ30DRAFT_734690 [Colletotrichum cereale]
MIGRALEPALVLILVRPVFPLSFPSLWPAVRLWTKTSVGCQALSQGRGLVQSETQAALPRLAPHKLSVAKRTSRRPGRWRGTGKQWTIQAASFGWKCRPGETAQQKPQQPHGPAVNCCGFMGCTRWFCKAQSPGRALECRP